MNSPEYERMFQQEDHYWWFVARRELALKLMEKHFSSGVILDIGCGTGAGMLAFSKFGTLIGLDYSAEALQFSAVRGIPNLIHGDAQHLPFASGSADGIVSLDTVEHLERDSQALREFARVLRPGGTLLINVPAYQWLWGPHDVALMHFRRYHRSQLRRRVQAAGLQHVQSSYHVFFLFPLVLLARVIGKFKSGPPEAKMPSVPKWLNRMLLGLQRLEHWLLLRTGLPWGSSLVIVAQKPLSGANAALDERRAPPGVDRSRNEESRE